MQSANITTNAVAGAAAREFVVTFSPATKSAKVMMPVKRRDVARIISVRLHSYVRGINFLVTIARTMTSASHITVAMACAN